MTEIRPYTVVFCVLRLPFPIFISEEKCALKSLNPENGGMFLRNVDAKLQHYTVPQPRQPQSGLLQVDSWRSDARTYITAKIPFIPFFLISEANKRAISLLQIFGLNKRADLPTRAKQCVSDGQASYLEQKRTQCQFVKKSIWFIVTIRPINPKNHSINSMYGLI
jgi:hypothetical protein